MYILNAAVYKNHCMTRRTFKHLCLTFDYKFILGFG